MPFFQDHLTAMGAPLPEGTRFQLGVFTDGFVPDPGNPGAWLSKWKGRAEVVYSVEVKGFSASLDIEENPVPYAGAKFYIWGFRQTSASVSEWILFTDPGWIMPPVDPLAPPFEANTAAAGQVILGQIDAGTGALRTASVPVGAVPVFGYQDWLAQHFFLHEREDPAMSGALADVDVDGVPNWLEYTQGTSPWLGGAAGLLQIQLAAAGQVEVSFPVNPSAEPVWTLHKSMEVGAGWGTEPTAPVWNVPGQRWVWSLSSASATRQFWRIAYQP